MLKFIATDLDGTLLDEHKRLPAEIFGLIERLAQKGVLFAPASGRQYANLEALFSPVSDKIVFICENGALVKYRGETLYLDPIPAPAARRALAAVKSVPRLHPLLCCEGNTYLDSTAEPFCSYAKSAYTRCVFTEDLCAAADSEPVCKIAVFDELPAAEHAQSVLPRLLSGLRITLSGDDWCDVSVPTADKGAAIRFLRNHFGLRKEECAAFGDQMNDYEMLLECGTAYLPENAYPPLKERFRNTVPSNAEGGVIEKIKELLGDL